MAYLARRAADSAWMTPQAATTYSKTYSTSTNANLNSASLGNTQVLPYSDFLSGPDRLVQPYGAGPSFAYKSQEHLDYTNNFLNTWTGKNSGDAFVPYRADLGLNIYERSREEKASSFQDLWAGPYNAYVTGQITSKQLYSQALYSARAVDGDTLNTSQGSINSLLYNISKPPKVSYNFNGMSGSISSKLGSFRW